MFEEFHLATRGWFVDSIMYWSTLIPNKVRTVGAGSPGRGAFLASSSSAGPPGGLGTAEGVVEQLFWSSSALGAFF